MGSVDIHYDVTRTRLRALGSARVHYARWTGRPTSIGPLALRYEGEDHPVRVVCTDGRPGMDPGLTAVLFLVIHRRDYRTDLWD